MEESIAEFYLEQLESADYPVPLFVQFYLKLFDIELADDPEAKRTLLSNLYPALGKLYKAYGRKLVYLAILDCYDMPNYNGTNPYPILAYFIKKRLEKKSKVYEEVDLRETVTSILHETKTPLIIEDPFEESNE